MRGGCLEGWVHPHPNPPPKGEGILVFWGMGFVGCWDGVWIWGDVLRLAQDDWGLGGILGIGGVGVYQPPLGVLN